MCCNTKAPDLHDLFSILLLLPILRLFYPPLYITTITVLLRILEIEDEPLLLIYKSLARSVSLSLEMPRPPSPDCHCPSVAGAGAGVALCLAVTAGTDCRKASPGR